MKLLIDTHLLVWAADSLDRVPANAQVLMGDPENTLLFSAASIWEVAIKSALNRPSFQIDVRLLRRGLIDNGYVELPLRSEHAVAVDALPTLHKDPFDRMLIAQAIHEGITLLTHDTTMARYGSPVKFV